MKSSDFEVKVVIRPNVVKSHLFKMHISDSLPLQTIQLLFYFKMMDIFS